MTEEEELRAKAVTGGSIIGGRPLPNTADIGISILFPGLAILRSVYKKLKKKPLGPIFRFKTSGFCVNICHMSRDKTGSVWLSLSLSSVRPQDIPDNVLDKALDIFEKYSREYKKGTPSEKIRQEAAAFALENSPYVEYDPSQEKNWTPPAPSLLSIAVCR